MGRPKLRNGLAAGNKTKQRARNDKNNDQALEKHHDTKTYDPFSPSTPSGRVYDIYKGYQTQAIAAKEEYFREQAELLAEYDTFLGLDHHKRDYYAHISANLLPRHHSLLALRARHWSDMTFSQATACQRFIKLYSHARQTYPTRDEHDPKIQECKCSAALAWQDYDEALTMLVEHEIFAPDPYSDARDHFGQETPTGPLR